MMLKYFGLDLGAVVVGNSVNLQCIMTDYRCITF